MDCVTAPRARSNASSLGSLTMTSLTSTCTSCMWKRTPHTCSATPTAVSKCREDIDAMRGHNTLSAGEGAGKTEDEDTEGEDTRGLRAVTAVDVVQSNAM